MLNLLAALFPFFPLRMHHIHTGILVAADGNAHKSALVSYKAEVRAKSMAVSKAEIVLNEVCVAMASRLGRVDGVTVSPNKGRILLEVSPRTT